MVIAVACALAITAGLTQLDLLKVTKITI
ncbi:hypothetical protein NBG4_580013 [Candidatus Sulfobium mesophilum]|uniref:Uncharacterized protein n=1 Tax=Candidatus Sulfobium mesophilum TaxID=2016548 RepID=A0A2U3QJB3_9BACT|nr:hypothetical protein NBG4_580013 [Candidatus Sulfobium mesophilum]